MVTAAIGFLILELLIIMILLGLALSRIDIILRVLSSIKIYVIEIHRLQSLGTYYSPSPSSEIVEEEEEDEM